VSALTEHYGPKVPFRELSRLALHGMRLGTLQRTPTTSDVFASATMCFLTIWFSLVASGVWFIWLFDAQLTMDGPLWLNFAKSAFFLGWVAIVRTQRRLIRALVGLLLCNFVIADDLTGFLSRRQVGPIDLRFQILFHVALTLGALVVVLGLLIPVQSQHRFTAQLRWGVRFFTVLLAVFAWTFLKRHFPDGVTVQGRFHLAGVFALFSVLVASIAVPSQLKTSVHKNWPRWPFIVGAAVGLVEIESSLSSPTVAFAIRMTVSLVLAGLVLTAVGGSTTRPVPLLTLGMTLAYHGTWHWLISMSPQVPVTTLAVALTAIGISQVSTRRILLRT
jgi:hypothetical protein